MISVRLVVSLWWTVVRVAKSTNASYKQTDLLLTLFGLTYVFHHHIEVGILKLTGDSLTPVLNSHVGL